MVRVTCPQCRVELDVKNKFNVEQKVIKCPNCGYQMMVRFRQYADPANMAQPMQGGMPGQQQPYPQQAYQQQAYQQPYQQQQQYQQQAYQQQVYQQPYQQQQQYQQRQQIRQQPPVDDGRTYYAEQLQQQRPQPMLQPAQQQVQQPVQQQVQQRVQQPIQQGPVAAPVMGGYSSEATELVNGRVAPNPNLAAYLVYNNKKYDLNLGRNTIGRKSSTPKATVLIETPPNDKTMSRFHAVIECVRMPDGSIRSIISNGENKNPTFVAGVLLNGADKLVVKNGGEIKMGNILLRFELPF